VRDNAVVSSAHNSVIGELDATAHAEVVAIRQGCRELRALQLSGCELYVTVEPCPMCLSACHYAGVDRIYFGAPISEMQAITGNELCIDRETLFQNNAGPMVSGGLFEDDCIALLKQWQDGGS
jgi:tRNA(Arg) A34 adenosine deaminase TadA